MQKYYITESLGEVRKRTPEGYLLCVGVPIARTGEYQYAAEEMPEYEANEDGIIVCEINRTCKETDSKQTSGRDKRIPKLCC